MTLVGNINVDCVVKDIVDYVIDNSTENLDDAIRNAIGRYLGIRTEDGNERLYEVSLIDGEPYVMDG